MQSALHFLLFQKSVYMDEPNPLRIVLPDFLLMNGICHTNTGANFCNFIISVSYLHAFTSFTSKVNFILATHSMFVNLFFTSKVNFSQGQRVCIDRLSHIPLKCLQTQQWGGIHDPTPTIDLEHLLFC